MASQADTMKLIKNQSRQTWSFGYMIEDGLHQTRIDDQFEKYQSEAAEMVDQNIEQMSEEEVKDRVDSSEISHTAQTQNHQRRQNHQRQIVQRGDDRRNEDDSQSQYIDRHRRIPNRNNEPYPTKNFLQAFWPIFRNEIVRCLPRAINHQKIQQIIAKRCMTCKDVDDLFKVPQFQDIFDHYFRSKKIYRDLMQSGVSKQRKKIYLLRVGGLERGFRRGSYTRINELLH